MARAPGIHRPRLKPLYRQNSCRSAENLVAASWSALVVLLLLIAWRTKERSFLQRACLFSRSSFALARYAFETPPTVPTVINRPCQTGVPRL